MIMPSPFMMMFMSTLMLSTIMAMSSTNWLMVWMAFELNLISFIPMINSSYNFQETEAAVKYLLTQALGSSLLILSSTSMWLSTNLIPDMNMVLMFSLIIKIGMAPCHLWYPSVMTSISWVPAMILSTWQKLAPLSIMAFIMKSSSTSLIMIIASLNALTGGMMGMNQSHMRTIMAYSSITHMGWMLALINMNLPIQTIIYFFMYSMLIAPIFILMSTLNMQTMSQMNSTMSKQKNNFLLIPLLFLSLGGLPPLTGFFPKWLVIFLLTPEHMILLLFLIAGSLMNLYFYLNIVFSSMLSSYIKNINWSNNKPLNSNVLLFMSMMLIPVLPTMIM